MKTTKIESVRELDSMEMVDSANQLIKSHEKKGWEFISMVNDFSHGTYIAILTFQKEVIDERNAKTKRKNKKSDA